MIKPEDILNAAIEKYSPRHIIGLFSGGHDSLVSTHWLLSQRPNALIAHINTGIGIEETRDYVREMVNSWNRELLEYLATEYCQRSGKPDPQIYEEIVLEYGFPGPGQHTTMYARLKERPLRALLRDLERKRHDRILLVTGVRRQESVRRMAAVQPIQEWPREATKIWVAPLIDFSSADISHYIAEYNLRRNQVSDLLHGSKECLCGAFAHAGELQEIETWYPETGRRLRDLETQVKSIHGWGWDEQVPEKVPVSFPWFGEQILCSSCIKLP